MKFEDRNIIFIKVFDLIICLKEGTKLSKDEVAKFLYRLLIPDIVFVTL